MAGRTLVTKLSPFLIATRSPSLLRLRPLIAAGDGLLRRSVVASVSGGALRSFSSRPTTSSLNDPSPNWSNRPPKETILLDGCDFEHWLIVMEPPEPNATRDEIIDSYIKTLAEVVGSEQEARMKIYSVSTKHYFAFGALVSEELSYKIKTLPKVRWVLPDSYLDVKNNDYGGEPFINGEAVPYDPKYHEEWVRNNARANERSRRNDRPRNFDRSRNFERRRETMQNRDAPPMQNQDFRSNPVASPPNAPPPSMGNHDFNRMPNSNAPPSQPPSNVGYQNQVPPMQNQDFQSTPAASPPNAPPPPMGNHNFNRMPNSNALPSQTLPNVGYQNQAPPKQNQDFQSNPAASPPNAPPPPMGNRDFNRMSNSNAPPLQPPPNVGYQNQVPNTNYQGSPQAYQGQGGGAPAYQGQGYQGGNPGYQGGAPGYQGGNPGYQGGNPGYRGGGPPPPQGGNNYQAGNGTGYQVYQGGGNPPPSYQGGSYQGGNPTNNYQGGNPAYQGRDVPGRDSE